MLALLLLPVATAAALTASTACISVDITKQYQEVDGFGCSEAFSRAEDVLGGQGLSSTNQSFVLDLLFDVNKGAGFTILRNDIGSNNSTAHSNMTTIELSNPGSPEATPQYTWDRYNTGQFPLSQQAVQRGLPYVYANAWSAPWFMKTNQDENNGGYICGVPGEACLSGDWRQAYADYLIQYVQFYKSSGIDISYLGSYNEPAYTTKYASMLSNGTQSADFIKLLGKTIENKGVDVKLTCCDNFGWDQQEANMEGLNAIGEDGKSASGYLSVITAHGYASAPTYPLSTDKKTWQSEWADLTGRFTPTVFYNNGSQGEGLTWAGRIQTAFVQANVSAFLYWIGAEAALGNSALIALQGDEVIPSKRFWVFASFSKFVRPGARRIEASSSNPALTVSAFINTDGKVAVQVINNSTQDATISLDVAGPVTQYTTNNQCDLHQSAAIPARKGKVSATVPAYSLVSFVGECKKL